VRLIAFGAEATGVIAIGQVATGVIAIGQLATGVVAIGQLSRGVLAFGQLSLGMVTAGQLSAGVAWSGGIGVGGTAGPGLVFGLAGRLRVRPRLQFERARMRGGPAIVLRAAIGLALAALVWFVAIGPLLHDLTRVGGVFRAPPHVLR
jgi:hypothetical protein